MKLSDVPKRTHAAKGDAVRPDDNEQSRRFIETAREIGADEKSSAADEVMGRLTKQPPEPRKPVRSK